MIKIGRTHHVHTMSPRHTPCIQVASGSRLIMETWDALKGNAKRYFEENTPYEQIFPVANPATGPMYIEGAEPGDVLEVEIHEIRLGAGGYIHIVRNYFVEGEVERSTQLVEIGVDGNEMEYNGVRLPVEPMIGVIGTAPLQEMWCQETGDHGGNMDNRMIRPGATVLLPVFVEGALLAAGDVHAAMGDGEVFGSGVEIDAEIELTVRLRKQWKLNRPAVVTEEHVATVASHQELTQAKDWAIADMGTYLMQQYGINSEEAYALIAFYGDLQFCQVVNPQKTVRMQVAKKHIARFV